MVIAVILAVETRSLLLGESASKAHVQAIRGAVANADTELVHLRTMHVGPEELLIAAKIAVYHDDTAAEVARGIDAAEAKIRAQFPEAQLIYLEPALDEADRKNAAKPETPASS